MSPRALVVEKTPQRPLSARGCIKLGPEKRTPSKDYLKIRKRHRGTKYSMWNCNVAPNAMQCNGSVSVLSYNLCLFVSVNSGSSFQIPQTPTNKFVVFLFCRKYYFCRLSSSESDPSELEPTDAQTKPERLNRCSPLNLFCKISQKIVQVTQLDAKT